MSLVTELGADYQRFRAEHPGCWFAQPFLAQGFLAIVEHRVERRVRAVLHRIPVVGRALSKICIIPQRLAEVLTGISIPSTAIIGRGLFIPHFGPIIINGRVSLGENCLLSHGTTIGVGGPRSGSVCPSIGDRVFIGAGAIIIGAVDVGDDAVIGAGAVVTKSVPPRGVVVGNPARVIAMTGSFDLIHYRGMETDTKRAESHRAILVDQQMATSFATSELLPRKRVP